ncbi:MAG: PilZ domain-containing protein [Terriglobales bacterium]
MAVLATVEQRAMPRIFYRDLKITYNRCAERVETRSPDLSPKGMFINTPRTFARGAQLTLQFELLRAGVMVHTVGEVRYCLVGVGIGVEFVHLPEYARAAIEMELEEMKKQEGS